MKPLAITCLILCLSGYAHAQITISAIGDSTTNGVGSSDGGAYRSYVKAAFGDSIDFLGRRDDGPGPDNQDEGWGSFTINNTRDQTLPTIPFHSGYGQIVLLTIGLNDLWWADAGTPEEKSQKALTDLEDCLYTLFGYAPNSSVYVASINPMYDWNNHVGFPQISMYNAGLPGLVDRLKADHDIHFVDAGGLLNYESDLFDGIHPNDAGYAKIGAAWVSALSGVIPEPAGLISVAPLIALTSRRCRRAA